MGCFHYKTSRIESSPCSMQQSFIVIKWYLSNNYKESYDEGVIRPQELSPPV
jgi:hypothetical protein